MIFMEMKQKNQIGLKKLRFSTQFFFVKISGIGYNKLMQSASMWLNQFGCQVVQHKESFYPVFELMSDSLTTI